MGNRGATRKQRGGAVHNKVHMVGGIVHALLCESGDGRDTVHSSRIRGLMKRKKNPEKQTNRERESEREKRPSNPQLGAHICPAKYVILTSHFMFRRCSRVFPECSRVAAVAAASVICRF